MFMLLIVQVTDVQEKALKQIGTQVTRVIRQV